MTIGAVSAYGFQPYVYNTNTVSAASMNKLSKISDDVLDKKVDYSEITDESLNENPLKKGQTLDFQGMLEQQMQKGMLNAARVMKPAEEAQAAVSGTVDDEAFDSALAAETVDKGALDNAMTTEAAADTAAFYGDSAAAGNSGGYGSYQMQQAIHAYEMMMIA